MRRRAAGLAVLAVAAGGLALWRWPTEDAMGFVEVKRGFAILDPRDVIRVNDIEVPRTTATADGMTSVVVRQRTGDIRLDYARGDAARTLCSFALKKNRIVTATLAQTRTGITCTVKS